RVTCYRVGIRMRDPAMPSLLVSHHRPGFYLRVLQEGLVEAGDEIVRVSTGPEELTVAEIDGLLYLPNRSRLRLEHAVRIPALSEGWKESFKTLLAQADRPGDPGESLRPAWTGFQPLTVASIERESATVISFHLRPTVGGGPAVHPQAGQYLTLRLRPRGGEEPSVIRNYSLSSIGVDDGYRISVKREAGGTGSGFL